MIQVRVIVDEGGVEELAFGIHFCVPFLLPGLPDVHRDRHRELGGRRCGPRLRRRMRAVPVRVIVHAFSTTRPGRRPLTCTVTQTVQVTMTGLGAYCLRSDFRFFPFAALLWLGLPPDQSGGCGMVNRRRLDGHGHGHGLFETIWITATAGRSRSRSRSTRDDIDHRGRDRDGADSDSPCGPSPTVTPRGSAPLPAS